MMEQFSAEQQALMEPPLLTLARMGRAVTGVEYARAYHRVRTSYILTMRALYERFDLVVLPAMPRPAFEVLLDHPGVQDGRWRSDWTPFTFPFNLTSQPACSLPCGLTVAGLPIGVQIVGPWGSDARVLRAANAFEEAVGPFPFPPIVGSAVAANKRTSAVSERQ
jgi:aspartyl-tRNA(Asn)/glutamyl-tRNA(Gln) amidotransferase subunit A